MEKLFTRLTSGRKRSSQSVLELKVLRREENDVSREDSIINGDEIDRLLENYLMEKLGTDPIYDDVCAREIVRIFRENHCLRSLQEAAGAVWEEKEKCRRPGSEVSENGRTCQIQKKTHDRVDCLIFFRLLCRRLFYIMEGKRRRRH